MKAHTRLTREAGDRAALYALGGMLGDDASHFEQHLETCDTCREEVSSLRSVVNDLLRAAPETEPSPGLRERVLERVRRKPFTFLPAAETS